MEVSLDSVSIGQLKTRKNIAVLLGNLLKSNVRGI